MKRLKRTILALLALVVLSVGTFLWSVHNSVPFRDAVNPAYWVHRWRGVADYDPDTRVLRNGNRRLKEIALTIDDGPHSGTGDRLLDVFKEYGIRVTFFVVGSRMKERPDLVRRMLAEGHEVGNHSLTHLRLDELRPDQVRHEINDCDINFCRLTHRHFRVMRPPGVRYNDTVIGVAKELNYQIVSWGVAAKDFEESVTPDFIVNRVLRRVGNGSIILLHDDYPSTVAAMPRILAALKRDGYTFVTVSEMLAHLPRPVHIQSNPGPTAAMGLAVSPGNGARPDRELARGGQP